MLTGDENIVDVNSVLWKIKPNRVGDYLFNVQSPESTVKAVGESVMRAVIGHSNILTGARQSIETAVQEGMQKTAGRLRRRRRGAAGPAAESRDPPTQVRTMRRLPERSIVRQTVRMTEGRRFSRLAQQAQSQF
jgi:regulator of protease activity HflC (stomatin/prohibitin superfamily)